jgi:hypothetical protein
MGASFFVGFGVAPAPASPPKPRRADIDKGKIRNRHIAWPMVRRRFFSVSSQKNFLKRREENPVFDITHRHEIRFYVSSSVVLRPIFSFPFS